MGEPLIRTVEAAGVPTRAAIYGDGPGPAVVLLHGGTPGHVPYAGGSHLWGAFPAVLGQTRRVIAFDSPGSGGTAAGGDAPTVHAIAAHAAAMIEALADGPAHVVGHDLGGLAGATLALGRPDLLASLAVVASAAAAPSGDGVDNLTFLAPPAPPYGRETQRWAYERMSYAHHHVDDALLDASVAAGAGLAHRDVLRRMADPAFAHALPASVARAKFDFFRAAREGALRVPTQVVWASHDPLVGRDHGLWLFRIVAASERRSQFHLVNRSGSLPFREQPEAVLHILSAFQDGLVAEVAKPS